MIEGLVEGGCVLKQTPHIRHIGHVPMIEGLVEGGCVIKHSVHIRHIGHNPMIEGLARSFTSFFIFWF